MCNIIYLSYKECENNHGHYDMTQRIAIGLEVLDLDNILIVVILVIFFKNRVKIVVTLALQFE